MMPEGNEQQVPAGCYVVIRMSDRVHHMRIMTGPMSEEEARDKLVTCGPEQLMAVLESAAALTEKEINDPTLH